MAKGGMPQLGYTTLLRGIMTPISEGLLREIPLAMMSIGMLTQRIIHSSL